ncbi:hypothetical protein FRC18_002318 [Serendipita sp. 400]|nr:hypothetical protein FRC18_002318 [Serendipita sp. 400]
MSNENTNIIAAHNHNDDAATPMMMGAVNAPPPPSYDSVTTTTYTVHHIDSDKPFPLDRKLQQPQHTAEPTISIYQPPAGPSSTTYQALPTTSTSPAPNGSGTVTVYHYIHPQTQHRIDSLLPPSHPKMLCLQYGHQLKSRFGVAGILAAIFWFPLGLGCLLIDRDTVCARCKRVVKPRCGSEGEDEPAEVVQDGHAMWIR